MKTDFATPGCFTEVLQPFIDRREIAGAVILVADNDNVLSLEALGFADLTSGKPMSTDALFWIASQSKSIAASAFMMLVDEGLVKTDDLVEKYLPEFSQQWLLVEHDNEHQLLKKPVHPITIHNILSHTSGLPFMSAMEGPKRDHLQLCDAVRSYAMTPLQFQPDSAYLYSNAGINTAARIIEVVTGMAYEDFLQQRLLEPMDLHDTTFWPDDAQLKRLAKSYQSTAENPELTEIEISHFQYPLNNRCRRPIPAGGLFSTATDVARFCQMILNGGEYAGKRYLSDEAITQMTHKQTSAAITESYGLGWVTGDGTFGHDGAYSTSMNIDTKRGLITVFLIQYSGAGQQGSKSRDAFMAKARALI